MKLISGVLLNCELIFFVVLILNFLPILMSVPVTLLNEASSAETL